MQKYKCLERKRSRRYGNVIGYVLEDKFGNTLMIGKEELKYKIKTNEIEIENITLSKDNKLLFKNQNKTLHNKSKMTLQDMQRRCSLNVLKNDTTTAYDEYGNILPEHWKIQEEINFPVIIGNQIITKIPDVCFKHYKSLRKINIPDTITEIGFNAFGDCTNLKEIKLPQNLEIISDYVFKNCTSLKQISIPNTVHTIGNDAFAICTKLKEITIPQRVTKLGSGVFSYCLGLEKANIQANISKIKEYVFANCVSLETLIISQKVKALGYCSITDCRRLKSITMSKELYDTYKTTPFFLDLRSGNTKFYEHYTQIEL